MLKTRLTNKMSKKSFCKAIRLKFNISTLIIFMFLPLHLLATSTLNKPFLMLAHTWNEKMDINNWFMSEKLDGVRAYWTGKQLVSRAGNTFHVPKWFTQNFPSVPLDGELWIYVTPSSSPKSKTNHITKKSSK
ncbi:MAG: hypothetical protein HQK75_10430 [Candidatus Magnetomorum sp.]|nr:hypothetical protein [Candidatus Magnetomorum sp.]